MDGPSWLQLALRRNIPICDSLTCLRISDYTLNNLKILEINRL
jgi:hypothetical protein